MRTRLSFVALGFAVLVLPATAAHAEGPAAAPETPAAEPPLWSSLAVAASYGGSVHNGSLWHGPGLILAIDEPRWLADPEVFVEARWVLPQESDNLSTHVQTIAARAGVSARVSAHVRLGLGLGVDRESMRFSNILPVANGMGVMSSTTVAPDWQPAARVFGRVSSRSWRGFAASATLFFEAVHSPDPQNALRGGLSIEGWWRTRGGD